MYAKIYQVIYSLNDGGKREGEYYSRENALRAVRRRARKAAGTYRGVLSDSRIEVWCGSECVLEMNAVREAHGAWTLTTTWRNDQ